ncbi:MAG TPA: PKD domain-containing protein, partial [Bacteroidales bacterium]|nr:PKD domain-containing protein [Bacteroidales bacterium]
VFLSLVFSCMTLFRVYGQLAGVQDVGCDASFRATPDTTNPMNIHFEDISTGNITLWQWSFGDGVTSTVQHPVHTYLSGGTYFVCLTVSSNDTLNPCHDVLCIALTIHEPGTCVADFIYQSDPGDHLKIYFSEKSTGNINHWHWNFGDGIVSEERNCIHHFPAYQTYRVCLTAYNSDSVSVCEDTRCDSIKLDGLISCAASFISELDSANPQPNTFRFRSTSAGNPNQYLWRFDDGAIYHTADVIHHFESGGAHEVCLRIRKDDHGIMICTDSVCFGVISPEYFNIGGHLFAGNHPINNPVATGDTGVAYLFRMNGLALTILDTCRFTKLGYFTFPERLNGKYLIRAELTPGSASRSRYFPGYYEQSLYWNESSGLVISGASSFAADIHLPPTCDTLQGPGKILGKVVRAFPGPGNSDMPGTEVILLDGQMKPVLCTYTNQHGEFAFENLPFGTYFARAECPGLWSRINLIWLDESVPVADSNRLEVFNHDVTGVGEVPDAGYQVGEIYPNPSSGKITLPVDCPRGRMLIVRVRTLTGRLLETVSWFCHTGLNQIALPDPDVPPGMYLVTLTLPENPVMVVRKLVRY